MIDPEKVRGLRTHVKQCQLATWSDQQKFLRLADESLLYKWHYRRGAATCGLCMEIYQDVLDRIDTMLNEEAAQADERRAVVSSGRLGAADV